MVLLSKNCQDEGKLIVVTGPSGAGKGTLLQILFDRYPGQIVFSISATTRLPRPHEVDGREYFFWSRAQFEQKKREGAFLEWAEYAGNLYGTPRQFVEEWTALGKIVILEIDLVGARQVAQTFPKAKRIFIAPPSMEVLEQRLRDRNTDTPAAIARRLEHARAEMAASSEFDLTITNDNLETAVKQLEKAILT